jgi:hypothetical protein
VSLIVRPAAESDVPWLLAQLRAFDLEYETIRKFFDSEQMEEHAVWVRHMLHQGPWFLACRLEDVGDEREEVPVGFIAGMLSGHPYQPDITVLTELFWWVVPEARYSRAALMLIKRFVAHGKAHADWITFSVTTKTKIHPTTLEAFGFRHLETSYVLEVE